MTWVYCLGCVGPACVSRPRKPATVGAWWRFRLQCDVSLCFPCFALFIQIIWNKQTFFFSLVFPTCLNLNFGLGLLKCCQNKQGLKPDKKIRVDITGKLKSKKACGWPQKGGWNWQPGLESAYDKFTMCLHRLCTSSKLTQAELEYYSCFYWVYLILLGQFIPVSRQNKALYRLHGSPLHPILSSGSVFGPWHMICQGVESRRAAFPAI